MSIDFDRIDYLLDQRSQSWVAEQTGIPQSTLSYVVNGLRELPVKYSSNVAETYLRETALRLSDDGLPLHQIPRFNSSDPDTVRSIENYVLETANKLAEGYAIRKAVEEDIPDYQVEQFVADTILDSVQYITDSLRKSEKPIEEWEDYLSKYERELGFPL